ncbi:MAG: hypothetical protein ABJC74_12885, partial [Gemmatimonadota bacterium]
MASGDGAQARRSAAMAAAMTGVELRAEARASAELPAVAGGHCPAAVEGRAARADAAPGSGREARADAGSGS